ncbi:M1 family metallopeptidase [Marivita sp. S0852]|uniref:M1 family metallopeptidase n=1 Tax=Marivita sp. S0852 TaxID=3373893 RepID=UPI003982B59C
MPIHRPLLGLVLIAATVITLTSMTRAQASDRVISLSFDPDGARVLITLPGASANDLADAQLPDWLTVAAPQSGVLDGANAIVLQGVLPGIDDANQNYGASSTGAYMIRALAGLPALENAASDRITIQTPGHYRGVVTGTLIAESIAPDMYSATFELDDTWSDADVFFGPYDIQERIIEQPAGDVRVRTYFRPEDQGFAQDYLNAAEGYITRYSQNIGPYPNSGFAIVSAPIPVGYAFDGLTYISKDILGHPYMLGRSLAHEILHNWWGSGVRMDYNSGNWAEGLTTYQADYALAADRSAKGAKAMRRDWLASLTALPAGRDYTLRDFRSSGHNGDQSVGYGKSAMVFHRLNENLGSDVFDAALRNFWRSHEGNVAGWQDLQSAFETESGQSLDAFFSQFLDRRGLPQVTLQNATVIDTEDGFAVTLRLRQDSKPYALSLPIVLETVSGRAQRTVLFDKAMAEFRFTVNDQPTRLSVDPDFHVLRQLSEGELPSTLQDVLRADEVALVASDGAAGVSQQLVTQVFRDPERINITDTLKTVSDTSVIIVVGTAEQIQARRKAHFDTNIPDMATSGHSRVWVEADRTSRLWLFISAHDVQSLPETLSALRYYGTQSYLVFDRTARPKTGRWPVKDSPLVVNFEQD